MIDARLNKFVQFNRFANKVITRIYTMHNIIYYIIQFDVILCLLYEIYENSKFRKITSKSNITKYNIIYYIQIRDILPNRPVHAYHII